MSISSPCKNILHVTEYDDSIKAVIFKDFSFLFYYIILNQYIDHGFLSFIF